MNQALSRYMDEVMTECSSRIPPSAVYVDEEAQSKYPVGLKVFRFLYDDVMNRACKARRAAESRADALDMAVDSILAKTWYVRVGEVWPMTVENPVLQEDGATEMVESKLWATLVLERD